jgi:hypothetical protein
VDNFFKNNTDFEMTMQQFYKWMQEMKQEEKTKPAHKEEKKQWVKKMSNYYYTKKKYETVIELAKQEWLLSTDGIVKALRYRAKDKQFVAKVHYKKGTKAIEDHMTVSLDWVIDTYGKELAKKLIDREEHQEFVVPVNDNGMLTVLKLDDRKIIRVKYCPATYGDIKDARGNISRNVWAKPNWKGMLEDGLVIKIPEEEVTRQFGSRFVNECKMLGIRKFVDIPVGSCRSAAMTYFPKMKCDGAPAIKYRQGEVDSCVFSSLASAFYHTQIPELVKVANILQCNIVRLSGGANCLEMAREFVDKNVNWLQARKLPKTFNWETDINDYMFVVGVIQDSTNACQHAVTIFHNWIFDSNESFALPLNKESLDCCTWDIKDGVINEPSMFVKFCNGWIFQEQETKKKKRLEKIAPAKNVNDA